MFARTGEGRRRHGCRRGRAFRAPSSGTMIVVEAPTDVHKVARFWWLYLALGIAWILFGMWLWSYRVGSLVALAALIGATMLFNGITEIVIASHFPIWRGIFIGVGVLSVAGGVATIAWPGP